MWKSFRRPFRKQFYWLADSGSAQPRWYGGGHCKNTPTSVVLSLDQDVLNSKVSYWTDNGAYDCYCNNQQQPSVQPMHVSIKALRQYHRSLGLNVSLYHFDPFWHSAHSNGLCEGPFASNWSGRPRKTRLTSNNCSLTLFNPL